MKNRGFVTFSKGSEASCALINRKKFSELFVLAPADTWNQQVDVCASRSSDEMFCDQNDSRLFAMLNDDCLLHVISFLDILDVILIKNICKKFSELAEIHVKTVKKLNFDEIKQKQKLTLHETKMVLETVGTNVIETSVNSEKFRNQRVLSLIPKYLTNLKHLKLTGFKMEPMNFWDQMSSILMQLETLDLSDNSEINENFLKCFKKSDPKLKLLNVSNCTIKGSSMEVLKNIESLNISGCRFITGKQVIKFVESNKNLKSLNISKCPNLFGKDVNELLLKASQLNALSLNNYYIDDLTSKFVIPSINPLVNLKELTIHNINYPPCDQLLRTIYLENCIELLNISYGNLTLTSVYAISTMKRLKKLIMNFKNSVPEDFVDYLMELVSLEELHISGCSYISPANVSRLFMLPKFCFLDISRCYGFTNEFVVEVVQHLKENQFEKKVKIHVGQTEIDQKVLKTKEFQSFREFLQLVWETAKDVEHDYDIDEENKYEMNKPDNSNHQECFTIDGEFTI